ncbi:L-type lectin-domain containing receptor kinase IX.1-like [Beta vulgaris subsp. vulgaris]|uniref:L-type lectin-domain containing receptor kinase IX.1-like n=1 Tax=Beta vulgaris subsp. vulgaris TaxID=3555 RepID=UPI0020369A9D|nr:L-type lectin-domain containing receptor kinase IX.1-like [Beta vulgaris subsp. vulgaris]
MENICVFSITIISSLLLTPLLPVALSLSFEFPRFDQNCSNIFLHGDATCSNGTVDFNIIEYSLRVGLITYDKKVRLWDKNSGNVSDFSTHFTFVIDTLNRTPGSYGHGLAFFIAPVGFQSPPNSATVFLGLFNDTTSNSSSNQMILVEFDSFINTHDEPLFEHVGININSLTSSIYAPWNASEHSGNVADVWIDYNATTRNLSVFWSYPNEPDSRANSSLVWPIDLPQVIPEWVSIGFSASTGTVIERHTLHSWEFYSSLEVTDELDGTHNIHKKKRLEDWLSWIVPLCALIFLLGGIAIFFLYRKRKQMQKKKEEENLFNDEVERGVGPRRFSYSELDSATDNFSSEQKVGQGGFGGVYKGYLSDLNIPIAVKRFLRGSKQGKTEYITEVRIISRLRHRNLVQLIGWCHDKGEFLLVYEFMPNGSLDAHLFGKKAPLSWPTRYKITLELASGVLYLHEEWHQCVVHRDIKSSNIMLDSNFDVKLGDFGLATLMDHGHSTTIGTLAGTYGYMAPEYIATRKASKETDVYSFGVVVLEIATGKRSRNLIDGENQNCLVQWVWDLYGNGELLSATDKRLVMDSNAKEMECLLLVGLWCVHPEYNMRPSIKQAIQVLNFEATLPSNSLKRPAPMTYKSSPSCSSYAPSLILTSLDIGR